MHLRLSALITFALSVTSFVLVLLVIISGNDNGLMSKFRMVGLNTSNVLPNPVQTTNAGVAGASPSPNPLDPLAPLTSLLANPIKRAVATSAPLVRREAMPHIVAADKSVTKSLATRGLIDGALNGVITGVIDQIGVKQYYTVHMRRVCYGNLTDTNDIAITRCQGFGQAIGALDSTIQNLSPDVSLLGTNYSIPAFRQELQGTQDTLKRLSASYSGLAFPLFIIVEIFGGALFLLSLAHVFLPDNRKLTYGCVLCSNIASAFSFLGCLVVTVVTYETTSYLHPYSDALNIQIFNGTNAVGVLWGAWLFLFLSSIFWWVVWFVEFRRFAFRARRRAPDQMGNYRGLKNEMVADMKFMEAAEFDAEKPEPPSHHEEPMAMAEATPARSSLDEAVVCDGSDRGGDNNPDIKEDNTAGIKEAQMQETNRGEGSVEKKPKGGKFSEDLP